MPLRTDNIGFGGYKLIQNSDAFCYGIDAVLLADFSACEKNDLVADLGSGNGVIPLIIEALYSPKRIVGVELQTEAFELAEQNARINGLDDKISFINCDIIDMRDHLDPACFDVVICNPPYTERGRGPLSPSGALQVARHESSAGFADFVSAASWLLRAGGSFAFIHRPSRLVDLLSVCREADLEPKELRMIIPQPGGSPNLVLVKAVKGAGHELRVLPTLCVRDAEGRYTDELQRIYRR